MRAKPQLDTYLRAFGVFFIVWWVANFIWAVRKPADWVPPRAQTFPIRITRSLYLVGCVLGIGAGLVLFLVAPAVVAATS